MSSVCNSQILKTLNWRVYNFAGQVDINSGTKQLQLAKSRRDFSMYGNVLSDLFLSQQMTLMRQYNHSVSPKVSAKTRSSV